MVLIGVLRFSFCVVFDGRYEDKFRKKREMTFQVLKFVQLFSWRPATEFRINMPNSTLCNVQRAIVERF